MKKKKILIYLTAAIIPPLIFLLCSALNGYLPFGEELLNAYDSFTQYPGLLLDYMRNLKDGNIFFSLKGALGYNLFGTATYYAFSPLNLLALFANSNNYPYFIAIMTYLRFSLLGLTMCFYLDHKNYSPSQVILWSIVYALMGFTGAYYYNYIWIDSIIMLPLVIHGLDKLLEKNLPTFYIVTLTITIVINYYIGYMICAFSLLWFIYRLVTLEEKKKKVLTFFKSSLLAGLMSSFVLIPSFFALLSGKASLYESVNYWGLTPHILSIPYTLTTGSFQTNDQSYGPALIYSSILALTLTIYYFFTKSFSKKEKYATAGVLIFFALSLSVNFLNFAWQFFQEPIWWQSRFSFVISFFLITIAARTYPQIDKTSLNTKKKLLIASLTVFALIASAIYKWHSQSVLQIFTYFYLGFSILLFLELFFTVDKKGFAAMIMIFTILEVSVNTFNDLKINYRYNAVTNYHHLKEKLPSIISNLEKNSDDFTRFELVDKYTSNDALYFGYNGVNYFNSVRNIKTIKLLEKLGFKTFDDCQVNLTDFDPVILSLLNIKYVYGLIEYLDPVEDIIYENRYSLGIGFMAKEDIRDLKLEEDKVYNKNSIVKALTGFEEDLYRTVTFDDFTNFKDEYFERLTYSFKADKHYLLLLEDLGGTVLINGSSRQVEPKIIEIKKGDKVDINYEIREAFTKEDVFFSLLDVDKYEKCIQELKTNKLDASKGKFDTILESSVEVTEDMPYLFTSIPYEDGMTLYVDEKKADIDKVLGGLVGIKLSPGMHTVKLKYVPKGFTSGLTLSALGFTLTVLYLQKRKKAL